MPKNDLDLSQVPDWLPQSPFPIDDSLNAEGKESIMRTIWELSNLIREPQFYGLTKVMQRTNLWLVIWIDRRANFNALNYEGRLVTGFPVHDGDYNCIVRAIEQKYETYILGEHPFADIFNYQKFIDMDTPERIRSAFYSNASVLMSKAKQNNGNLFLRTQDILSEQGY